MANSSVVNLNADFVRSRRSNLNILNRQVFSRLPGHSRLEVVNGWLIHADVERDTNLTCNGLGTD